MSAKIEIQTLNHDDFSMKYFSFGTGPQPLIIIPGASLKSVMLSADAIAAAYAPFTEKFTVYVFDLRENIPEGFTVYNMADDTAKAMQLLKIENAVVFGCSLGGMIAQYIAVHYPELVSRLVLSSTLSRRNRTSTETCRIWHRLAETRDVHALNRFVAQRVYSGRFYELYKSFFDAAEGDGSADEMRRFSIIAQACGSFDIYDELCKITCPVFVIGSWDDRTLSGEACVEIAEKLRCRLYMYSDYGHAVYDEAPDFKNRVLDFLAL